MSKLFGFILILCIAGSVNCFFNHEPKLVNDVLLELKRWANITTSSTCGTEGPERFCLVTSTGRDKGHRCEICNAQIPELAYPITYAIDGTDRWWKSANDPGKVIITLNLKQQFFVTSVLIKIGPSPKPAIWSLERSTDYGHTYRPWQHFVSFPDACEIKFNMEPNMRIRQTDDVICKSSRVIDIEYEEVLIDLIKGRPGSNNFITNEKLQNWTRATNVRLAFYQLQTFLGELVVKDSSVKRTHFYTIRDIVISGRCVCHGHENGCEFNSSTGEMECRCVHNTCGKHCENCCPGYHQYHWQPLLKTNNGFNFKGCRACNCHGHSNECYFNATVAEKHLSLDTDGKYVGGGVCLNCLRNTQGINCEQCKNGYYRLSHESISIPNICKECNCNTLGSKISTCNNIGGECSCHPNVIGRVCSQCKPYYWNFPNCEPCNCSSFGSIGQDCNNLTGQCNCKNGMVGLKCDLCINPNISIQTSSGCIVCHQCSLEHFNSFRHLLQLTNTTFYDLKTYVPPDSWVHVRLRYIDSWLKAILYHYRHLFQSYFTSKQKTARLTKISNDLKKLKENGFYKSYSNITKFSDNVLWKATAVKRNVANVAKQNEELLNVINIATNSLSNSKFIFNNLSQTYPSKCKNSCLEYIESGSKQFWKEISEKKYLGKREFCQAELVEAKLLCETAKLMQMDDKKLVKSQILLNRMNRTIVNIYKDLTLLSFYSAEVDSLKNLNLSMGVKKNTSLINSEINHYQKILELMESARKLSHKYQIKMSANKYEALNFLRRSTELKTSVVNRGNKFVELGKIRTWYFGAISKQINESQWIITEFKFLDDAVKPLKQTMKTIQKVGTIVNESKNEANQARFILTMMEKQMEVVFEHLANLILVPEDLLYNSVSKAFPKVNIIETDDEDYGSSGYYQTDPNNSQDSNNLKLNYGLMYFNDMVKSDRVKVDNAHHAIKDKMYEFTALPSLLANGDEVWLQNKKNLQILSNNFLNFTKHQKDVKSIGTKYLANCQNTIFSSRDTIERVKYLVDSSGNEYHHKKKQLHIDSKHLQENLFEVNRLISTLSTFTEKLKNNKFNLYRLPENLAKINSIISKNEKAYNSICEYLSPFQVPLYFRAAAFVQISLQDALVTKSLITTVEFWFKMSNPDAFLLRFGNSSDLATSVTFYVQSYRFVIVINHNGNEKIINSEAILNLDQWHFIDFKWLDNVINIFVATGISKPLKIVRERLNHSSIHEFEPLVYVGGHPEIDSYFSYYFTGCLGGLKINKRNINLFAWKSVKGTVKSCSTSPFDNSKQLITLSFNNNGGIFVQSSNESLSVIPQVEFSFRTMQKNGVIAYFSDLNKLEEMFIKLIDGRVVVHFEDKNKSKFLYISSSKKYNDGRLHHVNMAPISKSLITGVRLTVDQLDRTSGSLYNPTSKKNVIYLGSSKPYDTTKLQTNKNEPDFVGCLHELKINSKSLLQDTLSTMNRFDFSMATCPTLMGDCMCLNNGSSGPIRVKPLGFRINTLNLLFSLNSNESYNSTVFYYSTSPYTWMEIYATPNRMLWLKWKIGTNEGIKDLKERLLLTNLTISMWHSIVLKNKFDENNTSAEVFVDGEKMILPIELFIDLKFSAQQLLYLGGKPIDGYLTTFRPHFICYRDFLLNDDFKDFSDYTIVNRLEICPDVETTKKSQI